MKTLCTILCLLLGLSGLAQRKHSVSIGIDYVKHTYPSAWKSERISKQDFFSDKKFTYNSGYWASYYYREKMSLRFYMADFFQHAHYKVAKETPGIFLATRYARFYDFVVGYNFSSLLSNVVSSDYLNRLGIWLYGGATYLDDGTEVTYEFYNPAAWNGTAGGYGDLDINHSVRYYQKIRPTAHFQIKYNPIRYILLGIGGTYHHIGKDFKPVSGNISLGLQL